MLKYVFMGTPEFAATILQRFAHRKGAPVLVVTQPPREAGRGRKPQPSAVQALCEKNAWAFLAPQSVNDDEAMRTLQEVKPDLVLVAAFGQILKKPLLELPRYCLNVHGSLLPRYRGAAPVQRAILNADEQTGITIQRMALKLDTGDILVQRTVAIAKQVTSTQLLERLSEVGAEALIEAVELIENGKEKFLPQEESHATYAPKLDKKEAPIDWRRTAARIERQVYGLQPWPTAETRFGLERVKIFGAEALSGDSRKAPGTVLTDHKTYLHIACGEGVLSLTEVQLENRNRVSIVDFLRGYRGNFPFTLVGDRGSG